MISEALSYITNDLNTYFKNRLQTPEDKVVLSGILDQDGVISIQGENKIAITLVNVCKDTATKHSTSFIPAGAVTNAAPVHLSFDVLFSAYFNGTEYAGALKYLSFIIDYFQAKSVFTRDNDAGLDPNIARISFELSSLSFEELNQVWGTLGAKYMPSVVYKMRMETFNTTWVVDRVNV